MSVAWCCISRKRGGIGTRIRRASRVVSTLPAHRASRRSATSVIARGASTTSALRGRSDGVLARAVARRQPPLDVRLADPPLGDQPIGRRATVQRPGASRRTTSTPIASRRRTPSTCRLRCAFGACSGSNVHSMRSTPLRQRALALRDLQSLTEAVAARFRADAQHVRPVRRRAVAPGRHRPDEPDEPPFRRLAGPGADQNAAALAPTRAAPTRAPFRRRGPRPRS